MDPTSRTTAKAQRSLRKIGMGLVQEKQCAVLEERASGREPVSEKGKERDLLSLMIKSNMDTSVPEEQRLSVDQIMHQIPTFIVAGLSFVLTHSNTNTSFKVTKRPRHQRLGPCMHFH
jgi:cytochrome P450